MKYKIGVFGSSAGDMAKVMPKAIELGKALGEYKDLVIVVTGGAAGLPYAVAKEATAAGVEVWGYSAYFDLESHTEAMPDDDHGIYTKLLYVPGDYPFADNKQARMKYRNVASTATVDAAIFISGRWGTLNEFTNLTDMNKPAGILTGTGGIADELPALTKKIHKEGQGEIIFDDDPASLIAKILNALKVNRDS